MNTTIETIPTVWDDERDGQFFRITASLFEPHFCSGAGGLLASYDPDDTFADSAPVVTSYDTATATHPITETTGHVRSHR
jgi:hypothetical protein